MANNPPPTNQGSVQQSTNSRLNVIKHAWNQNPHMGFELVATGQVLFLLEKWWREAGFWFGDVCAVCLAKSVFRC